jgi:hypothetical protein
MHNDGSYYWNGRILRITKSAGLELMVASLTGHDVVEGLKDAVPCPRSRRRRNLRDWCARIQGVEYKIVIADDNVRDFHNEVCWTLIHIKPYGWGNL